MAKPKVRRKKKDRARRLHQEPIVREVARLLEAGTPTRWRWTSQARHGLRAGLCLKGMSWATADSRAEKMVTLARHRIGLSEFPSWIAAQGAAPEVREFYYCACCEGFMPDGNGSPWCAEECRLTLREKARQATGRRDEETRRRAVRVILTGGTPAAPKTAERLCRGCGKTIKPTNGRDQRWYRKDQRYCSHVCSAKRPKYSTRPCLICASPFQPHQHKQIVCGPACAHEARLRRLRAKHVHRAYVRPCRECGAEFIAHRSTSVMCECCRPASARSRSNKSGCGQQRLST